MTKSVLILKHGGKRQGPSARTLRRANQGKRRVKIGIRATIFFVVLAIIAAVLGTSENVSIEKLQGDHHRVSGK
jgi:hypothetical protein